MVNIFVFSGGDESQIMTKLYLIIEKMTQTCRKKSPEALLELQMTVIRDGLIRFSASIVNINLNCKIISHFRPAFPFMGPCDS